MKKYLFILLAAMVFVACSDDNEPGTGIESVPESEVPEEVKNALKSHSSFDFSGNNYCIINSIDDLEKVCQEEVTGPNENFFKKYSIIAGVIRTNDTGYDIKYVRLQDEGENYRLDVYMDDYEWAFMALSWFFYWGVFPKLESKPVNVCPMLTDGTPYTFPQEKYNGAKCFVP